LKDAHKEMELIRSSLSYRLGNALITPIKTAGVIAKNPKAIKNYLRALKVKVIQLRRRMTPLKVHQLRRLRNSQRSVLSYNGKKALIYVIFESESRLQEYKLRFLQALAPLVDDVISTGQSLKALERLVEKAGGKVLAKAAILAEGDAKDRKDIIFLEALPTF